VVDDDHADGGNEVHFGKVHGAGALSALRFWRSIPDHETLLVNNSGLLPGERQRPRESRCSVRWMSDGRRRAAARDDLAAPDQEVATNELGAGGSTNAGRTGVHRAIGVACAVDQAGAVVLPVQAFWVSVSSRRMAIGQRSESTTRARGS
jgi:hypothetical protein